MSLLGVECCGTLNFGPTTEKGRCGAAEVLFLTGHDGGTSREGQGVGVRAFDRESADPSDRREQRDCNQLENDARAKERQCRVHRMNSALQPMQPQARGIFWKSCRLSLAIVMSSRTEHAPRKGAWLQPFEQYPRVIPLDGDPSARRTGHQASSRLRRSRGSQRLLLCDRRKLSLGSLDRWFISGVEIDDPSLGPVGWLEIHFCRD